jgi:hypothetical protein
MTMRWVHGALLLVTVALCSCTESGRPPTLEDVDDQLAAVGQELVVNLRATDPDGDSIRYGFETAAEGIQRNGVVSVRPDGTAVFRWTPQGSDVGSWAVDFTASDGQNTDVVTAMIEVRSALGEGSVPIFREPSGSGTGLDLERDSCLTLDIVVEDQDDAAVTLGQEAPVIDDAELIQDSGLTGSWSWCPNKAQLDEDRHRLVLSADDGENEKTLKNFLIVLRQPPRPDCPGEAPVVMHTPADVSTVLDIEISAEISDDLTLKNEPILYYTFTQPGDPIDFSALSLVQMELSSGDFTRGTWTGRIPNPVSDDPEGTQQKIWYIIAAGDDDDAAGNCDHVTEAPVGGTYEMTVTRSEGKGGAGLCEPCSANTQCGDAQDLCVVVDNESESYCLQWCENDGNCPADYSCADVQSFDGIGAKQCVPDSNTCTGDVTCTDDTFEDNDNRMEAATLTAGAHNNLVACAADEDWYAITVNTDTTVGAVLDGTSPNLNLGLYDDAGLAIAASNSAGSSEVIEECVSAGTYYWRVYGTSNGEPYDLLYEATPGSCTPQVCEDDSFEQDDGVSASTPVDIQAGFIATDRQICADDADFHEVTLGATDTIEVDLTFTQSTSDEDIDIHIFDDSGVDLTPCSPGNSGSCMTSNGQSGSSNELMVYTPPSAGTYHVVVMGYGSAENTYDILITLQ